VHFQLKILPVVTVKLSFYGRNRIELE